MRVLVLGADGMLGHSFYSYLAERSSRFEVVGTVRKDAVALEGLDLFSRGRVVTGVDARSTLRLVEILGEFQPDVVINGIGIVKQREAAKEAIACLELNALLPHRLSVLCKASGARLLQLSTDCIFSGSKGNYVESDFSDAEDLYGRSKYLGELHEPHCLTVRTSSVGLELRSSKGLLAWFLSQKGPVKGFRNAIYTGLTSPELARTVMDVLERYPQAHGLYHLSADPITKYDLLHLFARRFDHKIEITPEEGFRCDRSLDSTKFRRAFGYVPPSWEEMIAAMPNHN